MSGADLITLEESAREQARRVYRVTVAKDRAGALVAERLSEIARNVRLPGFRPGKIPANVIQARYGAKARRDVIQRLTGDAANRVIARGEMPAEIGLAAGADSGDVEVRIVATVLAELPPADFANLELVRLTAPDSVVRDAELTEETARELLENHLRKQVLDFLDESYRFPLAPALVAQEFSRIGEAARQALGSNAATPAGIDEELRAIAERRLRLGAVVTELSRREEIRVGDEKIRRGARQGETPPQTRDRLIEDGLIERILSKARVTERLATAEELRAVADALGSGH